MIKILVLSILTTLLACKSDGGSNSSSEGGRLSAPLFVSKILPKIALGDRHSCVVTDDEQALCWGKGTDGQLGNSLASNQDTPVYVVDGENSTTPIEDIVQIAGGYVHACALNIEGKVFCWGSQDEGQLGNGVTNGGYINYPVAVKTDITSDPSVDLSNIVQIASLGSHACALSSDNEVFCWGKGIEGQLGNNSDSSRNLPVKVVAKESTTNSLTGIIQIATGADHTCALNRGGEVFCWGAGASGQRGDNTTTNINYPVKVVNDSGGALLNNIAQVVAGSGHTCALKK